MESSQETPVDGRKLGVVAALAWYDEPAAFLERCVASLAGRVDVLVAFDGRWDAMPGPDLSGADQTDALAAAADVPGLALVTDARAWPSQVAKRDALMVEASKHGDWILVVDGDEELAAADFSQLADTEANHAILSIEHLNRPFPFHHLAPFAQRSARLFRAGVSCGGPRHFDYALEGDLLSDSPALDLTGKVRILHDNAARPSARVQAAQTYRRERRRRRLEPT